MSVVSGLFFDYFELDELTISDDIKMLKLPQNGVGYRIIVQSDSEIGGIEIPEENGTLILFFIANQRKLKLLHRANGRQSKENLYLPDTSDFEMVGYTSLYLRFDDALGGWHIVEGHK